MKTIKLGGGFYLAVFDDGTSILSGPDTTKFLSAEQTAAFLLSLVVMMDPFLALALLLLL